MVVSLKFLVTISVIYSPEKHRPENQRPQQKTKWQSPETKIIHPAEPSMQERFNRAWKKVNDEEAAAGETDEGALEGAVKCMMEK